MTKEEMFKEMKEMEPVLGRGGIDIVLGKRIPGSFTMGYFFNEEAGLWEVYSCGERNEYFVRKQTGSEQEAVEELYQIAKYEYESALRHLERERQRKGSLPLIKRTPPEKPPDSRPSPPSLKRTRRSCAGRYGRHFPKLAALTSFLPFCCGRV